MPQLRGCAHSRAMRSAIAANQQKLPSIVPTTTELTYDFSAPSRIVFGWGRRPMVGGLARSLGQRAFVVCGSRSLERNGALDEIVQSLREAGVDTVRAETISREPLVEDVDRCVSYLRENLAGAGDLLVAVGGGSAIDLAKAAGALVTQDSKGSVLEYLEGVGTGLKIVNTPLPVLAMPTTGGTGSEATKNAVISSYDPPFKKSLRSELMVPRIVLVDPELSVSVPPQITAWTGMDAITQLIESYISRRATPATDEIAERGMSFAVGSIGEACRDGASQTARVAMAHAALLSGIALANSGLGMAHGVAAALGAHCQVPHGLACAVMLPTAIRVNCLDESVQEKLGQAVMNRALAGIEAFPPESPELRKLWKLYAKGRASGNDYRHAMWCDRAADVLPRISALADELKIPRRLSELGVKRDQIPAIVRDSRGNSMSANPRDISDDELTKILEEML
jgi:alcohol dehydrogenase class IV